MAAKARGTGEIRGSIDSMTGPQFISESIFPGKGCFSAAAAAKGEPDFPGSFTWRDRKYEVLGLRESWKSTGRDLGGSTERYVRRHWFRVLVRCSRIDGPTEDLMLEMVIYFDRQQRTADRKKRWWLYTKETVADS